MPLWVKDSSFAVCTNHHVWVVVVDKGYRIDLHIRDRYRKLLPKICDHH